MSDESEGYTVVIFKGKRYLIIGDLDEGGAIATKEQYENGRVSFAHLLEDGRIMQFGSQIGTREDLQVVGTEQAAMTEDGTERTLTGEGWPNQGRWPLV